MDSDLYLALNLALNNVYRSSNGDRSDVEDYILLVTDGWSTRDLSGDLDDIADDLRRDNIAVIPFAVGSNVDTSTLRDIQYDTAASVEQVSSYRDMEFSVSTLVNYICGASLSKLAFHIPDIPFIPYYMYTM